MIKPFESTAIYANQGYRTAYCLAVLEGQALLEYEMPGGTTALRIVPADDPDTHRYKRVAYLKLPARWIIAMAEAGTFPDLMIATPQAGSWKVEQKIRDRIEHIVTSAATEPPDRYERS